MRVKLPPAKTRSAVAERLKLRSRGRSASPRARPAERRAMTAGPPAKRPLPNTVVRREYPRTFKWPENDILTKVGFNAAYIVLFSWRYGFQLRSHKFKKIALYQKCSDSVVSYTIILVPLAEFCIIFLCAITTCITALVQTFHDCSEPASCTCEVEQQPDNVKVKEHDIFQM